MDRQRKSKARSRTKQRLGEAIRHARPARRMGRDKLPRLKVKARGAVGAVPANDVVAPDDIADVLPEIAALDTKLEGAELEGVEAALLEDGAVVEEAVALPGVEAASDEDEDEEAEEVDEGEEEAEEAAPVQVRRAAADEPASFLAMYFRDMSELDVLKPEQEFETARHIEAMELDLWHDILGFVPGAGWMADVLDVAVGKPLPELKRYRARAERAHKDASIPARKAFDRSVSESALRLRGIDIDRLFMDAAVTEIARVGRGAQGLPFEGHVPFSVKTKAFKEHVKVVRAKAFKVRVAKNEFVKANLRLVVSIARRFNHGRLPLADLIQEGNIGLMKAVERYDYRRGFRFSTYASWWIRHAISRALADKGRAVRLPVHMIDAYHRVGKAQRELQSKLERPPTTAEVAAATGIEEEKLEKMKSFLADTPVSLDKPLSDEDGRRLIDVLVDPNEGPAVPDQMASSETQVEMVRLLQELKPIEADILRKRFGLENDRERTLKEIGDEYSLSRERVRQLQEQALGKMRRAMAKAGMI